MKKEKKLKLGKNKNITNLFSKSYGQSNLNNNLEKSDAIFVADFYNQFFQIDDNLKFSDTTKSGKNFEQDDNYTNNQFDSIPDNISKSSQNPIYSGNSISNNNTDNSIDNTKTSTSNNHNNSLNEQTIEETANDDKSKINLSSVDDYANKLARFEMEESFLLGEFDKDGNYVINEEIKKELIEVDKVVENKNNDGYYAIANCGNIKLEFIVTVRSFQDADAKICRVAQLKLLEYYVAQNKKIKFLNLIATFQDYDSPNFLFKVKSAFHLYSKAESGDKTLKNLSKVEKTLARLKNRFTLIEINTIKKESVELKYLTEIKKILNETPEGAKIVKRYQQIAQLNNINQNNKKELPKLRYILDKILNEAIAQKLLNEETTNKINKCREIFVVELNNTHNKFIDLKIPENKTEMLKTQTNTKSSNQGEKSGGSSAGGGGGGGSSKSSSGGGGGNGNNKQESKKDKNKESNAGIFGSLTNRLTGMKNGIEEKLETVKSSLDKNVKPNIKNGPQIIQANVGINLDLKLPHIPNLQELDEMKNIIEENISLKTKINDINVEKVLNPVDIEKVEMILNKNEEHNIDKGLEFSQIIFSSIKSTTVVQEVNVSKSKVNSQESEMSK